MVEHGAIIDMDLDLSEAAFANRDPWRLQVPSTAKAATTDVAFDFDVAMDASDNIFLSEKVAHAELKLPEPGEFHYGALDDLPSLEHSDATDEEWRVEDLPPPGTIDEPEVDHLWEDVVTDHLRAAEPQLLSWESFRVPGKVEPPSAYLSEAGDAAFDVAAHLCETESALPEELSVIRRDIFLRSLFALGLGRSSSLFRYDEKTKRFERSQEACNITGLSKESASSIIEQLTHCGRLVRQMREFVARTYASPRTYPAKVALANAIATTIDAIETQMTASWRDVASVLQLQHLFERPYKMLVEVYDLARAVRNARSNEDLAGLVYKRCQLCDQEPDWLRSMMLQILARVSQPWLSFAECWIGFKYDNGTHMSNDSSTFVQQELPSARDAEPSTSETPKDSEYVFKPENLPSFMPLEEGQTLFNLGRDLRILRAHHPEHPLAKSTTAAKQRVSLEWQSSWKQVERVATKAKELETALSQAIKAQRTRGPESALPADAGNLEPVTIEGEYNPFILDDIDKAGVSAALPDELYAVIHASLLDQKRIDVETMDGFSPPTTLLPVLSFKPLLRAQQRILNAVMIRKLFGSHSLRLHLDLQRNYHLLGDGVFVSRLTAALFDPDAASTERKQGVMRSGDGMGLRLGSRGSWPPASSELRLALMGILSDCYQGFLPTTAVRQGFSGRNKNDLPGSLSFAVRQLSEKDAEKIIDADSLHALDFLRLQYSPPSPLGAIITQASLDRYDTIFKFLLRLTRLLFVVAHLPKDFSHPQLRLFRWQADAFVTTCCRYFFETGVKETWSVFTRWLDSIESRLQEEDAADELGTRVREGIEDIRNMHDACLEKMTFALLLRMRQQKVLKVLEDAFTSILEFSKLSHSGNGKADEKRILSLHESFDEHVRLLLEVCKGLAGKKGYGKSINGAFRDARWEEKTIDRLVVALNYNGFHDRQA